MDKKKLVAFDFDGTITTKDTLILFIKFSKGVCKFWLGFLLFFPLLIACKAKLYPNGKLKQHLFSFFYKGTTLSAFQKECEAFAHHYQHIIRPKAMRQINEYLEQDCEMVMISASIENWVLPFAKKLAINQVICTKIDIDNTNKLTGYFSTSNCYGKEKVIRLLKQYPNREHYYLIAYGDSLGDRDLLDFADEQYYKFFV